MRGVLVDDAVLVADLDSHRLHTVLGDGRDPLVYRLDGQHPHRRVVLQLGLTVAAVDELDLADQLLVRRVELLPALAEISLEVVDGDLLQELARAQVALLGVGAAAPGQKQRQKQEETAHRAAIVARGSAVQWPPGAGSSNGRTPDSGSGSLGSSPSPAAYEAAGNSGFSFSVLRPATSDSAAASSTGWRGRRRSGKDPRRGERDVVAPPRIGGRGRRGYRCPEGACRAG